MVFDGFLIDEVTAQALFATHPRFGIEIDIAIARDHGHESDIGNDADRLNRHIARREILPDGEFERRFIGQFVEDLNAALAEARIADDEGSAVVFERSGDDFGSRGRRRIDEYDNRVIGLRRALGRFARLRKRIVDADRRDDRARRKEIVGDHDGLIEKTAGIAAQIEDEPVNSTHFGIELRKRLVDVALGIALEALELDIGNFVFELFGFDARDADFGAGDVDISRRFPAFAHDREVHDGIGIALEQIDGFANVHIERWRAIDREYLVAFFDTRASRGHVVIDRFDDDENAIDHADDDPKATEFSSVSFHHTAI